MVPTAPEKGLFALSYLQTFGVYVVFMKGFDHGIGEIISDNRNHFYLVGEVRSRQSDVGCGASNDFICFSKGGFDGVKCHSTND